MIADTFDNPAILGNYHCEPLLAFLWFSVNAITESCPIPKEFIKITGWNVELLRQICGGIRFAAARITEDVNARFQPGGQAI